MNLSCIGDLQTLRDLKCYVIIDIKLTRKSNLFFSQSSFSFVCVIANAPNKYKALHTMQNSNLTHRHKSDRQQGSVCYQQARPASGPVFITPLSYSHFFSKIAILHTVLHTLSYYCTTATSKRVLSYSNKRKQSN